MLAYTHLDLYNGRSQEESLQSDGGIIMSLDPQCIGQYHHV